MTNLNEYQHAEQTCEAALSSLHLYSGEVWLTMYASLFKEVTYGSDGLPTLPNCNFEGQHFENVSAFCAKYSEMQFINRSSCTVIDISPSNN